VITRQYLQFLSHASEIHVDKTPLTAQSQFSFQQEAVPLHYTVKVQNVPGDQLGAKKQSNGHQDPWISQPYIFPSGVI